jgi:hypothetical protein
MGYSQTDMVNYYNDVHQDYTIWIYYHDDNFSYSEPFYVQGSSSGTITVSHDCGELDYVQVLPIGCTGSIGYFYPDIPDINPVGDCDDTCLYGASGHWDGNTELYLVCN